MLEEVMQRLQSMPAKDLAALAAKTREARKGLVFIPNPGPQTEAYYCEADVLLFGGQPAGGKSSLGVGLALNSHYRSLLIRKSFTDLGGLLDTTEKLVSDPQNLVRGSRPRYDKPGGGVIHFAGVSSDGGIGGHQGVDHDFIYVDEAAQLPEKAVRMLMGWLRTERPGQRCRVVLGSNPPLDPVGDWMVVYFAPWLDPTHPNPAKPGELRYFLPGDDGKDYECDKNDTTLIEGMLVRAQSRTFIPSKLQDNPHYNAEEYSKTLAALPPAEREILVSGNFMLARKDQANQAIPLAWVKAAIARWTEKKPRGVPMCAIGVDASGGGDDPLVIAPRYDGWYPDLVQVEGRDIPQLRIGKHQAGVVASHRTDDADIVVDMGGGYGGPILEQLAENIETKYLIAYKGAERAKRRTKDGKLGFHNWRSQAIWQFREALDPGQDGGSPISLPNDPELIADLTAPTYELTPNGIKVESKEDVCARLGRSTNKGDAVVMAWQSGSKIITVTDDGAYSAEQGARRKGNGLTVNCGPRHSNGLRRH